MRKFVTLPFCVRLRLGELTTLPITVISVALTVLLGAVAPDGAAGAVPVCRELSGGCTLGNGFSVHLWTAQFTVDGGRSPRRSSSRTWSRTPTGTRPGGNLRWSEGSTAQVEAERP
jgi:hypothetical protein